MQPTKQILHYSCIVELREAETFSGVFPQIAIFAGFSRRKQPRCDVGAMRDKTPLVIKRLAAFSLFYHAKITSLLIVSEGSPVPFKNQLWIDI